MEMTDTSRKREIKKIFDLDPGFGEHEFTFKYEFEKDKELYSVDFTVEFKDEVAAETAMAAHDVGWGNKFRACFISFEDKETGRSYKFQPPTIESGAFFLKEVEDTTLYNSSDNLFSRFTRLGDKDGEEGCFYRVNKDFKIPCLREAYFETLFLTYDWSSNKKNKVSVKIRWCFFEKDESFFEMFKKEFIEFIALEDLKILHEDYLEFDIPLGTNSSSYMYSKDTHPLILKYDCRNTISFYDLVVKWAAEIKKEIKESCLLLDIFKDSSLTFKEKKEKSTYIIGTQYLKPTDYLYPNWEWNIKDRYSAFVHYETIEAIAEYLLKDYLINNHDDLLVKPKLIQAEQKAYVVIQ